MYGGRVALLCGTRREDTNAILEYTRCLDRALRDRGTASTVEVVEAGKPLPDLRAYDAVVLQYNPFLYGRWGFAPRLIASLFRVRMSARRPRLAIMVHEMYVPMRDWRSTTMGVAQRIQLHLLRAMSDLMFVSIESWAEVLGGWVPRRVTRHLPVGCNLPDRREERAAARDEIDAGEATLVVASFGTSHPSRLIDYIIAATNAMARHHDRVLMLNLGAGAPPLDGLHTAVRVLEPGLLAPGDLARMLSTADLFLAPFVDGVSTRRGSLMAAMQHALAIVGTCGYHTDECLRESCALDLVSASDVDAFAEAAIALAQDPARRAALGAAAAAYYERRFDWPVLATCLCDQLEVADSNGRRPRSFETV